MRRISFLLFSIALIASGMIIWQFVSFMMDVAIIGLKRYSRFTIVDETGHVETFNKTDAEDWTKV
jgi:hypothetical protein